MRLILTALYLIALGGTAFAQGEQKQTFGNIEIHYMLLNSTALDIHVAESYDITRSGKVGFLMLSILEITPERDLPTPIPAIIQARFKNLVGQEKVIELTEIREQDGLYYVGTFRFDNEDIYRFEFDVKITSDQVSPFEMRVQQRMYFE